MFGYKNKMIIKVEGMSCEHCAKKVCEAIMNTDNKCKVKVNLKNGEVTISSKNPVDIDNVKENVNKAGFTFVGVKV